MTPRRPLCCVLCDEPCHEVKQTNPETGAILRAGPAFPGTQEVRLALLSGAYATMTLCAGCEFTPERIPHAWRRCHLAAMERVRGDEQKRAEVLRQFRDVPLGVLTVRPSPLGKGAGQGVLG